LKAIPLNLLTLIVTALFVAIAPTVGDLKLFMRVEWLEPFKYVALVLIGFSLGAWYMWAKHVWVKRA